MTDCLLANYEDYTDTYIACTLPALFSEFRNLVYTPVPNSGQHIAIVAYLLNKSKHGIFLNIYNNY